MADFGRVFPIILELEGGYELTRDPKDSGGETYAGISRRANPDWPGWDRIDDGDEDSESLRSLVEERYRQRYWMPIRGNEIPSDDVARSMMSVAVLSGPVIAIRLAQTVLQLRPDGVLGPDTMGALAKLEEGSIWAAMFDARLCMARIARYCEIVRRRPKDRRFLRGWCRRALEDAQ